MFIHTQYLKKFTPSDRYNFNIHELILVIFGRNVMEIAYQINICKKKQDDR